VKKEFSEGKTKGHSCGRREGFGR